MLFHYKKFNLTALLCCITAVLVLPIQFTLAQDFDNDNVIDLLDLDDDNDGILDKNEDFCVTANADNGMFTGPTSSNISWDFPTGELQPFSLTDITIGQEFSVGPTSFIRKSGNYSFRINFSNAVPASEIVLVIFDYDRSGFINFSVTQGIASSLDFKALQYNGERMLTYSSSTGNLSRSSSMSINNPSEGIALVGLGSKTVSSITIETIGLSSGDQIGYFITTPPYCDYDQDGILNSRDLDSDNDGIYDVVEANGTISLAAGQNGRAQDDDDNVNNTATRGIPSSAGAGLSVVQTTTGVSNHLNVDSDGDTCYDTSEAGFTDQDYDGILGATPVIVDNNGLVTTGVDGYTNPGVAYLDATNTAICNTSIFIDNPISIDNIINQEEAKAIRISGTTTGAIDNQLVTITCTDLDLDKVEVLVVTTIDGNWVAPGIDISELKEGNILIQARIVNQFGFSDQKELNSILDQTPPVVNSISTSAILPVLTGSSEANARVDVEVSIDNDVVATYTTGTTTNGVWQVDTQTDTPVSGLFPTLNDNDSIIVRAIDVAGNIGLGNVSIDTTKPSVDSYRSSIVKPLLRGQGESNEILVVYVDINGDDRVDVVYQTRVDDQNNWSIDPNVALALEGFFYDTNTGDEVSIRVIDEASNVGMGIILIDLTDTDNDGYPDLEEEINGSDALDPCDPEPNAIPTGDCDRDGIENQFETGIDLENLQDTDNDNIPNIFDRDDDNDNVLTIDESPDPNGDGNPIDAIDSNGNGIPNYLEPNNSLNGEDGITVYEAISPNSDGLNDVLIIEGIENIENHLSIYNRWGTEVFRTKNYGKGQNYFTGIVNNENTTFAQKNGLPVGTYYYVLQYTLKTGLQKRRVGYIYINM